MKHIVLISTLIAMSSLVGCDKQPTVINLPAATVAVPGPAGPQGEAGVQGDKGETGRAGDGTTVIVTPPAPPPSSPYSLATPGSKP